jgi:hypothetical protein
MSKTASLTAGLVARKGEATPAAVSVVAPPAALQAAAEGSSAPVAPSTVYYKALTVKLDRSRYEALKTAGLKLDKKSQEIFVEALDAYLARIG